MTEMAMGLDFADMGRSLRLCPLAAVCAAVTYGFPLVDDRLPAGLLPALAQRCGIQIDDPLPGSVSPDTEALAPEPSHDPLQRRRVLRLILQRMIQRHQWLPSVADNHSMVRQLPSSERGLGRDAIEALLKSGWVRALKASADPALGLVTDFRTEIEAAVNDAVVTHPLLEQWIAE